MSELTEDYRQAPSGNGPLASEWKDKPHRLVYDLCSKVEASLAENSRLREVLKPFADLAAHPTIVEHYQDDDEVKVKAKHLRRALAAIEQMEPTE